MYKFLLDFSNTSVNKNGKYSISHMDKILYDDIEFPFEITFNDYLPLYQISITKKDCGTIKKYNLVNSYSTTFTTSLLPRTTKPYTPPTTSTTSSTTETTTTSTTTLGSLTLDVIVNSCYTTNNILFSNLTLNFSGNNSGKYKLQIKNFTTNEIVYSFNDPIIQTNTHKIGIRSGVYTFTAVDSVNNNIQYILTKEVNCPLPSLDVEYIPNICGKQDAKLKITNIKNATAIRYCFGNSFSCSNNINNPDLLVTPQITEGFINLNWGATIDYISGQFITIRAFNQTESSFVDFVIEASKCVPSTQQEYVVMITNTKDNGNDFNLKVSLVRNGVKFKTPVDLNISGYYSLETFLSDSMLQYPYSLSITSGSSEVSVNFVKNISDTLSYMCINTYNPTVVGDFIFTNSSPC